MPRTPVSTGIEIEYEEIGDPGAVPILLVMGLGAQMTTWDDGFCELLAGRGFRVIRFDNRDIGLSTWMDAAGPPDLMGIAAGTARSAYDLPDMVDDAAGLLDVLGIPAAHVVGASMGGMIAQLLAIRHPSRVLSLTSIMSLCDGAAESVQPTPEALAVLFTPPPDEIEAAVEWSVNASRVTWGPSFEEDRARDRARVALDRAYHPVGTARQLAAIWATPNWREGLAGVTVPALVVHGLQDPLIPVENGRRTVAALPPGADWLEIDGMGHDLPPAQWERVADAIVATAARARR